MAEFINQTIQLVTLWGQFLKRHPEASLKEFFNYQAAAAAKAEKIPTADGRLLPDINGRLIILLRRIGKFHISYSNKALEGSDLDQIRNPAF